MITRSNLRAVAFTAYRALNIIVVLSMMLSNALTVYAFTWTDPTDYPPGSTVTIRGNNSDADNEHNWSAGETVHVDVTGPNGYTAQCEGAADANGAWTCDVTLWATQEAVGQYSYTATGLTSGNSESGGFSDGNPSADLDQCANDEAPSPSSDGCNSNSNQWVNGNLGASKAVYFEGESIPYRLRFDNLTHASHTVTIEWDTTKSSTHALDYVTTYNSSVLDANPCLGVSGCGTPSTFAIPADQQVTNAGVTPVVGNFTLFGGTITAVSAYSYADGTGFTGDKSARITITFTADVTNPVLAWGGHISARADWGANNSAVAIPGSPYHTRLIDLDGAGGNQDRSLSADAVIFPGSITIVKDATPNGATSFGFTASPAPLADFSLVDDGTSANTKLFSKITAFQTYTVSESSIPAGWGFDSVSCSVTTPNGGSYTTATTTVNVNMKEGENWTCTYYDSSRLGTLIVKKHVVNDNGGTATADQWSIHVKSGAVEVSGSPQAGSEDGTSYSLLAGAYNVSETGGLAGYTFTGFSGDCDSSGNVTVAVGQTKTCTLTNDDQTAHLKLVKKVTNDNGGTAVESDWTLSAQGPTPLSGLGPAVESDVNAGTYTLSESGPGGYSTSGYDCGSSVTLALGESKICTITNDDQTAHLKLVKEVTNDNGGTAVATDWTLSAAGPTPLSGAGMVESDVNAGTYTLTESGPSNYTAGAWNCVGGTLSGNQVTLGLNGSAVCTITNNDNAPKLHLRKVVVNDNGGTATVADFTLMADGTGANDLSGVSPVDSGAGLKADTWALSESGPAGYAASAWSCVGGTQNGNTITVGIGQEATCTITNDDIAPKLHLRKMVVNNNGGAATTADFTLTADGTGTNDLSGTSPVDSGAGLQADTWALSETTLAGYSASAWSCVGGTQSGSSITVGIGQEATCTITNDDIAPKLHLRKVVVNNNGGTATVADFPLKADGTGTNDLLGTSPVDSGAGLQADTWALSETTLSSYAASAWSCVGGTQNGSSITVAIGQEATCTITNDDIAPKLHLRKVVVNNNGGMATTADFTLTANGAGANDLSGTSPVDSGAGLQADTWALSETGPAGYSASEWSCVGGTQSGSSITVGIGGEATCTITNDDIAPKLHLRKVVVNDNGGTATVANFTLTADGTGTNDLSGVSPVDSSADLKADTWVLSETGPAGYSAGTWACVGGTQNGSSISVGIGGEATCTITNDDQTAHLKLVKEVTNDNGGTAVPTDWTLSAAGPTPLSGAGMVESDVNAGTYTLTESGPSNYTAGAWSCVGGTLSGNQVTLGLNGSAVCTITNNDIAPKLHLRKVVVNDNGGTATVADFTLMADGTGANDLLGVSPVDSGAGLKADTWVLSESGPAGYSASAWVCVGGTQNGNNITVGIGGEATCTITNNDVAPKLHLRKVVVNDNGGTATVADFTLNANGTGANDLSGTSPVDSGAELQADTWALTETGPAGYSASEWVCVGGTQNGSSITVGIGQEATCTITNDDIAPRLHLRKVVVNNNGGTATAADFTLTANGAGSNDLSGTSPVDSGAGLQADTWALSETSLSGYSASAWSCVGGTQNGNNITVGIGGEATCTITNDDIAPKLHLRKVVVNNNGGTATVADFTLTADGTGTNDLSGTSPVDSAAGLKADTWALSETGPSDYAASAWVCVGGTQNGSNITVGIGGEATCTITNDDIAPKLHLRKVVVNNNGGTATVANFTLKADGAGANDLLGVSPVDSGASLQADTWVLSETGPAGYAASAWSCVGGTQVGSSITVGIGQEATCTITNDDIAPKLHLRKGVVNDNGGTATVASFPLKADGTGTNDLLGTSPVDSGAGLQADTWVLSETTLAGYTASSWVCVGGTQVVNSITVGIGGEATCTITNDDIAPKLKLVKEVINNNVVISTPHDWTLTATGTGGFSDFGDSITFHPVNANVQYALSESGPAGFTASAWTCVNGGTYVSPNKITLGLAEVVTCSITNTAQIIAFTPGFWKNHTEAPHDAWARTNFSTGDRLVDVFDAPQLLNLKPRGYKGDFTKITLLTALSFKGGPDINGATETLMRAAVAALLNASYNEKTLGFKGGYPLTVQGVKDAVRTALATGDRAKILSLAATLDGYNNGYHYIVW